MVRIRESQRSKEPVIKGHFSVLFEGNFRYGPRSYLVAGFLYMDTQLDFDSFYKDIILTDLMRFCRDYGYEKTYDFIVEHVSTDIRHNTKEDTGFSVTAYAIYEKHRKPHEPPVSLDAAPLWKLDQFNKWNFSQVKSFNDNYYSYKLSTSEIEEGMALKIEIFKTKPDLLQNNRENKSTMQYLIAAYLVLAFSVDLFNASTALVTFALIALFFFLNSTVLGRRISAYFNLYWDS